MMIMIVDDEESSRTLLADVLQKKFPGARIMQAETVNEAQDKLVELPADILFTDFNMIGENGLQLIRFVRGHERLKNTPIAMITARYRLQALVEKARELKFELFGKPIEEEKIFHFLSGINA